jgi:hypothetical protein
MSQLYGRLGWLAREAVSWHRKFSSSESYNSFSVPLRKLIRVPHRFITCPTELIKIRQQSSLAKIAPTTLGTLRHILKQDGLRGLYRGFAPTAGRELAYGTYFFTVCKWFSLGSQVNLFRNAFAVRGYMPIFQKQETARPISTAQLNASHRIRSSSEKTGFTERRRSPSKTHTHRAPRITDRRSGE